MRQKKAYPIVSQQTRDPSDEGERIRSMRQYIASEVETIVKDEVTLSLEALIRVGATPPSVPILVRQRSPVNQ